MDGHKVKWSNFHVTVNFNIDSESHIERIRRAVEEMPESEWLWTWLKQFDGSGQIDFDTHAQRLHVETVRLRAAIEHGGTHNHGLHVHIVIEVGHTTMVQISKSGVEKLFLHFVGYVPNVHCRFVRGQGEDKDFILHYLTKEVRNSQTTCLHLARRSHSCLQVPSYHPKDQSNSRLRSALLRGHDLGDASNDLPM